MSPDPAHRSFFSGKPTFGFGAALFVGAFVLLAIVYSSVLFATFVYGDEHRVLSSYRSEKNILPTFMGGLRQLGRPVTRVTFQLFKRMAGEGWDGVIWVRMMSLAFSALFIGTVSLVLGRAWNSRGMALATAVFLAGNQCVQVPAFYAMLSPYMVGNSAAAAAAALVMLPASSGRAPWLRCGVAFLLLQSAWFVFQVSPFVAGPIAAGIALATLVQQRRPIVMPQVVLSALLAVTMLVFVLIYRFVGKIEYEKAQEAVGLLDQILSGDVSQAWDMIKFNRVVETAYLTDLIGFIFGAMTQEFLRVLAVALIIGLLWCSFIIIGRRRNPELAEFIVTIALAFMLLLSAFIPLFADEFSSRQHIWVPVTIAWWVAIVTVYRQAVARRLIRFEAMPKPLLLGAVLMLAVAHLAVAGWAVKRKIVDPRNELASFMTSFFGQYGGRGLQTVKIVLPARRKIEKCAYEPCIGFYDSGSMEVQRLEDPVPLREWARRAGVAEGPTEAVVVEPDQADVDTLRLDLFAYENFGLSGGEGD
jgi:hypothetical protein